MRIAQLAERTNVSPASIKFYVREGLLPPGERIGPNQTAYSDEHEARLRLIKALIEVGGLTVDAARSVLESMQAAGSLGEVLGTAQRVASIEVQASEESLRRVREEVERQGWVIDPDNPGLKQCAAVFDAYLALGRSDLARLDIYAAASLAIAEVDLDLVDAADADRQVAAHTVVVATALGDKLLAGLRRITQDHVSRKRPQNQLPARPCDAKPPAPARNSQTNKR